MKQKILWYNQYIAVFKKGRTLAAGEDKKRRYIYTEKRDKAISRLSGHITKN